MRIQYAQLHIFPAYYAIYCVKSIQKIMRERYHMKTQKWLRTIPAACLLSSALLTVPTSSFAAIDMSSCTKKDYPQSCVEQTDPGVNNRTHAMYETINRLVEEDTLNEQTNWSGKSWYNFIRFNYLILPSQEQDVLYQLNRIDPNNVELSEVLKALNGYHNKTNSIQDYANTIKTTDLNATEYAEEPVVDPSSPQYKELNTVLKNQSNETLTKTGQIIGQKITSSTQVTNTHSLDVGRKFGMKSSVNIDVASFVKAGVEITDEIHANYSYINGTTTVNTKEDSVTTSPESVSLKPHTGAVITAKLSTPAYTGKLKGKMVLDGYYTDQVNSYPTWVQLGIYNKFKVISMHNPEIWNKLKDLHFSLDDTYKKVNFEGKLTVNERKAPGSNFESSTQIYELDANGEINYNKPVGTPDTKSGEVEIQSDTTKQRSLYLRMN